MDPVVLWWCRKRRMERKRRSMWVRPIYLNREELGEYYTMFNIIRHDEEKKSTMPECPIDPSRNYF